ncbi:MAG: DNRLRE domain-containing protein [Bacteroidota bacterium]
MDRYLFSLCLLLLLSLQAKAQTILAPTDDAYVVSDEPSTNFGSLQTLDVQATDGNNSNRYSYLRFDLSTLQELQGQVILQLHDVNDGPVNEDIQLRVFNETDFSENLLDSISQPTAFREIRYGRETGKIVRFDLTEWANYVIVAGEPLRVQLYTETAGPPAQFASSENTDTSLHPKLLCNKWRMATLPFVNLKEAVNTNLVQLGPQGRLAYNADERGSTLIDFGMVGYHQGMKPIPNVAVVRTFSPTFGDRTAEIQAVIDEVAGLPKDEHGHRGAILLTAGSYQIKGTLKIDSSGIVIRGEGSGATGTVLLNTDMTQITVLEIAGNNTIKKIPASRVNIVDTYVPIGGKRIIVESGHEFQPGDPVVIELRPNQLWIDSLGMDKLEEECGAGKENWTPQEFYVDSRNSILRVIGDTLYLNSPIADPIDGAYALGRILKYEFDGIEEVGIENIRFQSSVVSTEEEKRANVVISSLQIRNSWFRNIHADSFISSLLTMQGSHQITVDSCVVEGYISINSGGRRNAFNLVGRTSHVLVKNSTANEGRHSFTLAGRVRGPNVFYNCTSANAFAESGPRNKWSTGTLWEGFQTNNDLWIQNRRCDGVGQGWGGGQQLVWNSTINGSLVLQNPPLTHTNWSIGNTTTHSNTADNGFVADLGYVESENVPVGFSLYLRQAMDYQARNYSCQYPVGSSCDDLDPNTINDVIQADGCTCQGEKGFSVKLLLEGPYDEASGLMNDGLRTSGILSEVDPFGKGTRLTPNLLTVEGPDAVVDWVMMEVRDATNPNLLAAQIPLLLQRDGDVMSTEGSTFLSYQNLMGQNFILLLRHANHLYLSTATAVNFASNSLVDFSDPNNQLLGGNITGTILGDKLLMKGGDANGDGVINAIDKNQYWRTENGDTYEYGVTRADFNLDGVVNAIDKNEFWRRNNGRIVNLPN